MSHIANSDAEALFGKVFGVLDFGEVELIDYLGGDSRITEAARVSYRDTRTKSEDSRLIDYLMRNDHTSPFEQVVFTFRLKMPIFVARQWVRHRTARMNEVSGRYSVMPSEFYRPEKSDLNLQSESNRQGRGETLSAADADRALAMIESAYAAAKKSYEGLLEMGVAKEIARIVLPLSLYTEFYWQIDLHNLLHFLALRLDGHAQLEIRRYAEVLRDILRKACPMAFASFERHALNGVRLSADEAKYIASKLNGEDCSLSDRDARILSEKLKKANG